MTQQYTPSVDLTIFPRVNFLRTFTPRAYQRDDNGRIFGPYGTRYINDEARYPIADGATCMAGLLPFPVDLGPLVTTTPTGLFDLRDDCGTPTTYDLNPLN